jgi:hypothetical protein
MELASFSAGEARTLEQIAPPAVKSDDCSGHAVCGPASACVISVQLQAMATRTLASRFGAVHLPKRLLDCLPEQLLCLQLCQRHEPVPSGAHAQWSQAMV